MEKTFMARKMENVGPNQNQRFTGSGRNAAGAGPRAHAGKERRKVTLGSG